MSTNALNQVYKTGILAIEQALLTQNVSSGDTTIHVTGNYMTNTPFVEGQTYVIRDDAGVDKPNAERVMCLSKSITAVAMADGIGYTCSGTLTVAGYTENGWVGGTHNSYNKDNGGSVLTPGMEVAIQSTDFNCRFKTLTDAPKIEFDDEASRYATGDEGRDRSIAGARSGEITFTSKLAWGGSVSTEPKWRKLMESMGHIQKTYYRSENVVGFGYQPHTWANEITATIWIVAPENGAYPTQTVYRYCGAHGGNGCSIGCGKIGDVYMLTAKYSAAYVGTSELSLDHTRALTSPESNIPEVLLSNTCTVPTIWGRAVIAGHYASLSALLSGENLGAYQRFYSADGGDTTDGILAITKGSAVVKGDAFTVGSGGSTIVYVNNLKTLEISQFNLDFGGVVNPFIDQSTTTGYAYYATTDRDPKFTINPYHVRKSADDIDYLMTQEIVGKVTLASGSADHLKIEVPAAQLTQAALASREGYVNTSRTYRALRNNLDGTVHESALPDQLMYEVFIGSRY